MIHRRTLQAKKLIPNLDRGPSDFDVRHAFNAALTYNIPTANVGTVGKRYFAQLSVDTIFSLLGNPRKRLSPER